MIEEERLKKMKRLKDELRQAYITDGLLVGLSHDEAEEFIEKRFQRFWEQLENVRRIFEECADKGIRPPEKVIIINKADGTEHIIDINDDEEYDTPEYYSRLEMKTKGFAEKALKDKELLS